MTPRIKIRNFVTRYKYGHPCVDCGFTDIRALDFDHVRGEKIASISYLTSHADHLADVIVEIAKCDVRCANCHRIRHSEEGHTTLFSTKDQAAKKKWKELVKLARTKLFEIPVMP